MNAAQLALAVVLNELEAMRDMADDGMRVTRRVENELSTKWYEGRRDALTSAIVAVHVRIEKERTR